MNTEEAIAKNARKLILEKTNLIGGTHIGGSFSIIDFLVSFYLDKIKFLSKEELNNFYLGVSNPCDYQLIFSKGHCYIAQLAVLDSIFSDNFYLNQYFSQNSNYFGHPKRNISNFHFPVSTGSLGQGITFGNGLALANKIKKNDEVINVIIGDGEFNEGSCNEAILFAIQNKLNINFIIDNNNQMSLNYTDNIFSNGIIQKRFENLSINTFEINGHNNNNIKNLFSHLQNGTNLIILNTIKGKGVTFMEKEFKWHHRRLRDNEYQDALGELNEK
jgi:transketolase